MAKNMAFYGMTVVLVAAISTPAIAEELPANLLGKSASTLHRMNASTKSPLSAPRDCSSCALFKKPEERSLGARIASGIRISLKTAVAYDSKAEQFLNGSAQLKLLMGNKNFEAALEEIEAKTYNGPRVIVNAEIAYSPGGDAALDPTRTDSIEGLDASIAAARRQVQGQIVQQVDAALAQNPNLALMPQEAREALRAQLISDAMATANAAISDEREKQVARIENRTARLAKNNRIPEASVTLGVVLGNGAGIIYSKAGVATVGAGASQSFGESRLDQKLAFKSPVQQASDSDPTRVVKLGTEIATPGKSAVQVEAAAFHDRPATDGARVMFSTGLAVGDERFKRLYESEKLDSVKGTVRLKKAGTGEFYVSGAVRGDEHKREVAGGATLDLTKSTTLMVDGYRGSGQFLKEGASAYVSQQMPLNLEAVAGAAYVKDSFRSDMAAGRNVDDHHISYRKYTGGLNWNLVGDRTETSYWDLRMKAQGYYLDPIENVSDRHRGFGVHSGAYIEGAWGMPKKAAKPVLFESGGK